MTNLKGRILEVKYKWGQVTLLLQVDSSLESLQALSEECRSDLLSIDIKKHKEKRSLNANKYYWEMLGKLADKLKISNNRLHNTLLARYGEFKTFDGKIIEVEIPESESASNKVLEDSTTHLKPTSAIVFKKGELYRVYMMLLGSSEMNTKQFSRLVDGLLSECKEVGIPTISDEEVERMLANWKA